MSENAYVMLGNTFISTIKLLYLQISQNNLKWAITGSTSLALQNVNIIPKDIDIITNRDGAYKIEKIFSKFVTESVRFSQSKKIRSHFGTLRINGISIDIVGDIENYLDNGFWEEHIDWEKNIIQLSIGTYVIPVISLEYEYEIYKKINHLQRIKIIEKKNQNDKNST